LFRPVSNLYGDRVHILLEKTHPVPPPKCDGPFSGYCEPFHQGRKVQKQTQGTNTMDIVVLGIGILFFALSFAYIKACDIL